MVRFPKSATYSRDSGADAQLSLGFQGSKPSEKLSVLGVGDGFGSLSQSPNEYKLFAKTVT